jgi:two-component system NtrC family sensor kinase
MGQQSTLLRAVDKLEPRLDGLEDKRVTRTLDVLRSGLAVIGDAAERVKGIVDRLRHFARLDQAELQVSDINEGVRDTVGVLGDQLGRDVVVDLSLSEMADLTCYPAQLNQAITNLLLNAAQAMPDGGTIRITTDSDDDHVRIAVRDEGDGIAPDILDRIFDPGFTTRGVGLGGGMGLAIVHRIVDLHGGSSDVSSKLGVGTTVAIALPRERTSDDADD